MESSSFKYDVAFSFLQKDEELAITLSQQLSTRLTTFVYSEKQAELAGRDGEITFNHVLASEARLVIVLFRPGWGETKWTRIEQTAIRNRGYQEGYEFVLFVVLDESASIPEWIPKHQIWYNFNRFGIDGISASIENKLATMGVDTREPCLEEKAAGLNRQLIGARTRKEFLESDKAIPVAHGQATIVYDRIWKAAENISN